MKLARQRAIEWMDANAADPVALRRSLSFIERVNRRLHYTNATIRHLDRMTDGWPAGKMLSILDIATGSGDVPRAVCGWADRRGVDVRVIGIDRHEQTLSIAREQGDDPRISLLRADALKLPFSPGSFDIVMTSMFLHHLDDDDAAAVMRSADRIARHGIILADLSRSRRALAWISLFTLLADPMIKHDARVSVRQAFRKDEILALARRAGLEYLQYHRHFGHRFVLVGRKRP